MHFQYNVSMKFMDFMSEVKLQKKDVHWINIYMQFEVLSFKQELFEISRVYKIMSNDTLDLYFNLV